VANPTPGTILGAYRIEGQLGAGSMGEVFKAVDTGLNRRVAVKTLIVPRPPTGTISPAACFARPVRPRGSTTRRIAAE